MWHACNQQKWPTISLTHILRMKAVYIMQHITIIHPPLYDILHIGLDIHASDPPPFFYHGCMGWPWLAWWTIPQMTDTSFRMQKAVMHNTLITFRVFHMQFVPSYSAKENTIISLCSVILVSKPRTFTKHSLVYQYVHAWVYYTTSICQIPQVMNMCDIPGSKSTFTIAALQPTVLPLYPQYHLTN